MPVHNKLPLILVVTVVIAVAAGTWLVRRGNHDPVPVDGVATQAADPPATAGELRASTPRRASRAPVSTADRVGRRDALRDEYAQRSRELRARQAATYERESVDPAWAPQKEAELGKITENPAFKTAGVAPRDLKMSCKSTMCRIDGSFDASGTAEDWLLIYMSSVGSSLPNAVVSRTRNPDGSTGVQIYGRAR